MCSKITKKKLHTIKYCPSLNVDEDVADEFSIPVLL
jgi:hypothetical protein